MGKWFSLLLIATAAVGSDDKWVRLKSEHFEVLTDAGPGAGREVLRRFEQIRHVFETRTGRKNLTPLPVRVFVFRNASDFGPYQVHDNSAGYYQSGFDRDYIAMQVSGTDTYRVVYHEYTHLLLRHAGYRVPVWFNEGIAELFSTAEVGKSEVRVGQLIPAHVLTLRNDRMLDLATLTAVDHDSPFYNERGKSGMFYAQSWALIHMLNFAPDYRPGIANFTQMILSGQDAVAAFRQSFGKSPSVVIQDLQAYLRNGRFEGLRFRASRFDAATVPAETVSEVKAQLDLADLLAAVGKVQEARLAYGRLEAHHGQDADVLLALGQMALRTEDYRGARAYFERALGTGATSARLFFDYGMALRNLNEPEALVIEAFRRALAADDRFFDAHNYLGVLHLQAERFIEAVLYLRRAAELQPDRASVWENLAVALHKAGRKDEALAAAEKARRVADSPEEAARMDALLDLINSDADKIVQAPVAQPERADAALPPLPQLQGMLAQVDCLGARARLHIMTSPGKKLLLVRDASSVRLAGAGSAHTQFACGPMSPRPVIVTYRPAVHATYGTTGEVVSIEFR